MKRYDLIVIGGGPGGYTAAVRATQLGMKTALIERDNLGGTCLNWGCIPTKSLLRNAEIIHFLSRGRTFGFSFENLVVDYSAAQKRSRSVVMRQIRRIAALMKNSGVDVYEDSAFFTGSHSIELAKSNLKLKAENLIIATGAKTKELPIAPGDGFRIINFRNALEMTELPKTACIIGAGPIGMEFATIWNSYGTKVTVVEAMPDILPQEDEEISCEAERVYRKNGIKFITEASVEGLTVKEGMVDVTVRADKTIEVFTVEKVLISIGFIPNTEGLELETAEVSTEQGRIVVDDTMRTSSSHIYAIGDVTGKMGLAHVAMAQAMIAVETIAGNDTTPLRYHNIPRCTFGNPEVASVGLTERQAKESGYNVTTAKCPFLANGKAMGLDENGGFVKIIADASTKKTLGVHLVGGQVTEMISGPAGIIALHGSFDDLGNTIHPHPTLSEGIMEAAQKLGGYAIHF